MTRRTEMRTLPLLLALLVVAIPAVAQQGAARTALDIWVEHVNDASPEELEAYLFLAFSESFREQVPLDQMLAVHDQLEAIGTVEVGPVESESDTALVAFLRTSSGTWLRAQLSVAGDPPKIVGFLIQPAEPPGEAEADDEFEWSTLDELAAAVAERWDLPGVAIAWARLHEEPQVGVAGVRAVGGNDAVETSDRFHIGSITKSVTSTALGALVQAGTLSWSATLRELLPGVEMNAAFAEAELFHLVRHRAGIPQHLTHDDAEMRRLNGLPGSTTEQRAAYTAEVVVLDPLPDGFHYSNAGYAMAGYIGELASGRSWEQLVQEEVFDPLGLETCGIGWPATDQQPDQPRVHFGAQGSRRAQGLEEYPLRGFIGPAGDVHCSVADLARYGLAHLAGLSGEDGFLAAATIQELHRTDDDVPYAAGWGIDPESGQHRHNGSAGTFFSYLVIDPEARLVVAFLTNAGPPDGQFAGQRVVSEILLRTDDDVASRPSGPRIFAAALTRASAPLR